MGRKSRGTAARRIRAESDSVTSGKVSPENNARHWRKIQGFRIACRPIITPRAPVSASTLTARAGDVTLPFARTGQLTARTARAIAS